MTMTRSGYRYPSCVVCQVALEKGIRDQVKTGRCYIRGVGDVCAYHFHLMQDSTKTEWEEEQ